MKHFVCIILIVFVFLLNGCLFFMRPCDYPVDQVFKYDPKKAGAEIVTKLSLSETVDYINYQNDQLFYIVYDNSVDMIKFFDITNDEIKIKKEIQIPKIYFDNDDKYDYTYSMNIINDKMILLAGSMDKKMWEESKIYKIYGTMWFFDESTDSLTFYDNSSDFEDLSSICHFYYGNDHLVYTATSTGYRRYSGKQPYSRRDKIRCYCYNDENNNFEKIEDVTVDNEGYLFLTNNNIILNDYYVAQNAAVVNLLYIYNIDSDYNVSFVKKLNLTFLNLSSRVLGAFSDKDGNTWLAVKEYNQNNKTNSFFLVKLKLLNTPAADNEYLEQYW